MPKISPARVTLLTEEIREISGLSKHTIERLLANGTLPYRRIGSGRGRRVVPRAAVMELLGVKEDAAT